MGYWWNIWRLHSRPSPVYTEPFILKKLDSLAWIQSLVSHELFRNSHDELKDQISTPRNLGNKALGFKLLCLWVGFSRDYYIKSDSHIMKCCDMLWLNESILKFKHGDRFERNAQCGHTLWNSTRSLKFWYPDFQPCEHSYYELIDWALSLYQRDWDHYIDPTIKNFVYCFFSFFSSNLLWRWPIFSLWFTCQVRLWSTWIHCLKINEFHWSFHHASSKMPKTSTKTLNSILCCWTDNQCNSRIIGVTLVWLLTW